MEYKPAFDGVRALSVVAVVFFHCGVPGAGGGFVGLDMFFVLSGYLITSLLATEYRSGGIQIGRFYARRALRLFPTLLLVLAAYVVLAPVLWPSDDRWLSAALAGFYLYDYALAFWQLPYTVGHTWSLGVEEKFYLLWPLLLPLLLRTQRPIAWLLAAFVAVTAWRYYVAMRWAWPQAYFCFDTRMSGIVLGAIAALSGFKVSRYAVIVASLALAVLVALPSLPTSYQTEAVTLRITLAELAAFVIVCHAAEHAKSTFLASRPMVYIGRLSYGIYLWHFPFALLVRDSQPLWITLGSTIVFSFTMAAICLHLVDVPIKNWRQRAWPLLDPKRRATDAGNRSNVEDAGGEMISTTSGPPYEAAHEASRTHIHHA
ncbi:acyltransferase [Variovorax sp. J2P1-59]|uniref:acyltransferase family protein n=1 Tax=Variovorax flavidus TaxID=3053501 RepID=UPI0025786C6E|nr:acyltransferase [Variovorax sp. J2P1-59]MDM0074798.1 acyltransferase [Variovorax sp. J2P1-59]